MTAGGGSGIPPASSILADDLFLEVFHASPIAMAITRVSDATFVEANEAFRREVGYEPAELVGRSALDLGLWVDPGDRETMVRALRERGSVENFRARFRVRSGDVRTGAFSARAVEHRGEAWVLTTIHEPFERQLTELARRRRDAILEAVAFAAERFLTRSAWEADIREILERLGAAADVSRAYIFENGRIEDGTIIHRQRFEWAAEGIVPQIDAPFLQDFSFYDQGTGHWEAMLHRGEPVRGHARELPDAAREVFAARQILSLVLVPVFVGSNWWGFIGFDECLTDRQWTDGEIDALKAAASMLGAAIGRHRAESLVRETETKYRALVEQIPAITYTELIDERLTGLYVSPQIETILGLTQEEWIADPDLWRKRLHPDDRESAVEEYLAGRDRGEPFGLEYRMVARDGRVVWIREQAVTLREGDGPGFVQGVMFDLTERKEAEEQLRAAEAKYRALVENIPAVTYLESLDADPIAFYMSPQVESLLGYGAEDFRDPTFWGKHIHPDDTEKALAQEARSNATGEPYSWEYRMIAKDGRVVWIRDEAALVRKEDGKPLFWQGVLLDITERKQAEAELQRSFDLLRKADEERRNLLARVVQAQEEERRRIAADIHDDSIQKMAAVGLRLQTLNRHELGPEERRLLEHLERTVELSIGRLRRMMFELRPPALDRDGLAAAMHQHLEELAKEAGIETHLENRLVLEPGVGTRAIAYRIAQEALANVRKHAGAARVEVLLDSREGGLFVRIRDDGAGFATGDETAPGRHFGLAAMRERAELAGGWCRVDSAPGAGTTVDFWLPSSAVDEEAAS